MRNLRLEAFRQVDDFDGLERAPLDAHTATNAELFRDKANRRAGPHVDAELAGLVKWANLAALLLALLGLALIRVDNGNSEFIVSHFVLSTRLCRVRIFLNKLLNNNS